MSVSESSAAGLGETLVTELLPGPARLVFKLAEPVLKDYICSVLEESKAGKWILKSGTNVADRLTRCIPVLQDELTKAIRAALPSDISYDNAELEDSLHKLFDEARPSAAMLAPEKQEQLTRMLCLRYDQQNALLDTETIERAHRIIHAVLPVFVDLYTKRESFLSDAAIETADTVSKISGDTQAILEKLNSLVSALAKKPDPTTAAQRLQELWTAPLFLDRERPVDQQPTPESVFLMPCYLWEEETAPKDDLKDLLQNQLETKKALLILGRPGMGKSTLIAWYLHHAPYFETARRTAVHCFRDMTARPWENATEGNCLSLLCDAIHENRDTLQDTVLFLDGFDEIELDSASRQKYLTMLCGAAADINDLTLVITCREHFIEEKDLKKLPKSLPYLTLQPWDDEKIKTYVSTYAAARNETIHPSPLNEETREVLGIPLIQYMVLALGITLTTESNMAQVYDRIFTLEENQKGIYDRCINDTQYNELSRSPEYARLLKKQVHQLSCDIAHWMFTNGKTDLPLGPDSPYEKLLLRAAQEAEADAEQLNTAFRIGSFWEILSNSMRDVHSTEGLHGDDFGDSPEEKALAALVLGRTDTAHPAATGTLHFIHRSMYQYFVAEGFFRRLRRYEERQLNPPNGVRKPEALSPLAGAFAAHFSGARIDEVADKNNPDTAVRAYLEQGLCRRYSLDKPTVADALYRYWETAGEQIIRRGSAFCAGEALRWERDFPAPVQGCSVVPYAGSLELHQAEAVCTVNLCSALTLVQKLCKRPEKELIFETLQTADDVGKLWRESFAAALRRAGAEREWWLGLRRFALKGLDLQSADLYAADLSGADLSGADLSGADLFRADLSDADLSDADLPNADLSDADLSGANLRSANLRSADLHSADLSFADLSDADLSDADLRGADLRSADLRGADLSRADLSDADLSRADLSGADLSRADLFLADLTSTNRWGHPLSALNADTFRNAEFDILKVDGKIYSCDEFFATFFPDDTEK